MSPSLTPSRGPVESKVRRLLPQRDLGDVLRILDDIVTSAHAIDRERVQLAVLKLYEEEAGAHNLETVAQWAKVDWRDVLAWAQYPRQSRHRPATAEEIEADEAEWQAWLAR